MLQRTFAEFILAANIDCPVGKGKNFPVLINLTFAL